MKFGWTVSALGLLALALLVFVPERPVLSESARHSVWSGRSEVGRAEDGSGVVPIDDSLPHYERVGGIAGRLKSVGSDTMNNLMAGWTDGFRRLYPNVKTEIEGKGSGTAPTALIEGTASFGPMSRPLKPTEQDEFEDRFGYRATMLPTAVDMVGVYVHRDNPIVEIGLSFEQLDAAFSQTRFRGHREVMTWGQLGLQGYEDWENRPVSLYGRSAASGTYSFFKRTVLEDGDFKTNVKELSGSSSVVLGLANDEFGLGYSGIGYKTQDVALVPIRVERSDGAFLPKALNLTTYPLTRLLIIAVNYEPNGELDPLRREFVRFLMSAEGQEVVVREGFLPLSFDQARLAASRVGLDLQAR